MFLVELKSCSVLLHVFLIVWNPWLKPVKCAHEAGGQHRSLSFKFSSFLRPPGGSPSATGGANQMFPQFSFLNPAGLGWSSTSSKLLPSNQLPPNTGEVLHTARPPVSTTSLGSFPFNPHFLNPRDGENSTGNGKSFVRYLPHLNHSSLASSSEMFPFLNNNATNRTGGVFNIFPKGQLDFRMDDINVTSPSFGQGVFKTWSIGASPTSNGTGGKFFEHVYTDLQNKSDTFSSNITVFELRPSDIKDNSNNMMRSTQFHHHGNLDKGVITNKSHGSPFQTMFQELMLPSSVPNSSKHFINLPDSIRNRIDAMNSEMLTDKVKHSHFPSSELVPHLGVNTNKGNNPDNEVENIFKRLDLPMFKRKHLKLPSLEIQDKLRQLVDKWLRNQEGETSYNISVLDTPKETDKLLKVNVSNETKITPDLKVQKETKVQPEINIPKEIKVPLEVQTPKETNVPPAIYIPKEIKIPHEVKTTKETNVPPEIYIPKEIKVPHEVNTPRETNVPPEINIPKGIKVPHEVKTPRETNVPPEINFPKGIKVPHEVKTPKDTNVPPEINFPKQIKVPSEVKKPKETNVPPEINIPKEIKVPEKVKSPKDTNVPPEIYIPKEIKIPHDVKTPRETNVPPEIYIPKEIKVPHEVKTPKDTNVPPEINIPKEIKVPSDVNALEKTELQLELIHTSNVTKLPSRIINMHKEVISPHGLIDNHTDNLQMPPIGGKTYENDYINMITELTNEPTGNLVQTTKVPGNERLISKADRRNDTRWNKLTSRMNTSAPLHFNFDVTAYPNTTRKKEMRETSVLPDFMLKSNKSDFPDMEMVDKNENNFYQPGKTHNMTDLQNTPLIYSKALPEIKAKNLMAQTPLDTYPGNNKIKTPTKSFNTFNNKTTEKDFVSISPATGTKYEDTIRKSNDKIHSAGVINPATNTIEENYDITTLGKTTVSTRLTENINLDSKTRAEKDTESNKSKEHMGPKNIDINLINGQEKQFVTSGKISGSPFYSVTETELLNKIKAALPITTPVTHYDSTRGKDVTRKRNTFLIPTFTTNYRKVTEKMQTKVVTLLPMATPPPIIMRPFATPPPVVMPKPVATPPLILMPSPDATPPPIFMPPQIYNIKHEGLQFKTALSDMNDVGNRKQFIGGGNHLGNINISPKESIVNKHSATQETEMNIDSNNIESKKGKNLYFPDNMKSVYRNDPVQPFKGKRMEWDRKTSFENTRRKSPPKVTGLLEQMLSGSSSNTVNLFKLPSSPTFKERNKTPNIPTVKKQILPEVIPEDNKRPDPKVDGQKSRSLPISILEMFYNGFSKKKPKETLTPHIPEISNRNLKEKADVAASPRTDKNSNTFLNKMVLDPNKSGIVTATDHRNIKHSTMKYKDYVSQPLTDAGVNVGSARRRTEPVMDKKMPFLSQPNSKVNDKTRLGINILNYLLSF